MKEEGLSGKRGRGTVRNGVRRPSIQALTGFLPPVEPEHGGRLVVPHALHGKMLAMRTPWNHLEPCSGRLGMILPDRDSAQLWSHVYFSFPLKGIPESLRSCSGYTVNWLCDVRQVIHSVWASLFPTAK